jgi:hypothetical protein
MAAIGDSSQRRAQPPCVLERVVDRQLVIAGAPEQQRRAADAVEVSPRVVEDERT